MSVTPEKASAATVGPKAPPEKAHALLGGSNAARWVNCPGSIVLSADLPPLIAGPAAEEGTLAHAIAEQALLAIKNGGTVEWDTSTEDKLEMAEKVRGYVEYVRSRCHGLMLLVEDRVRLTEEAWGSIDAAVISPFGHGVLIDLKYGRVEVAAVDNYQLAFYAVCLAEKYDLQQVEAVIYQPHAGGASSWRMDADAIRHWNQTFREAVSRVRAKDPSLCAGAWCKYCPAQGVCPEAQRASLAVAKTEFAPAAMTNDQLAAVIAKADQIEAWLSSVRAVATAREFSAPGSIPGHKLVQGRAGNRKWAKSEGEVAQRLSAAGVDPWVRTLRSPAQVEKELGKDAVNQMTERSPGTPVLVPITDKRPALTLGSEFT
jgi:hypothetical protein